jgi:raffinose/stachyose/melibiose transport system substrate-binding protein
MFEEMFVKYHEINPGVVIELIPTGVGQGQQEQLQSLYASKNAPTFMNIDPGYVLDYKDKLLAFDEGQPWLKYLAEGAIEVGRFDGKVLGVPFTTQGYGINYNKRVVEKVIPGFDPKLIKTRNDLEAFFKELDAASIPPTMIHGANWSLGAHYLGLVYAVQSPETEGGKVFLEGLRDGTVDIGENPIFQGYMDTFDLLAKYNYNKADPLVGNIITDDQAFAQGKCASFFMGDWAWTIIGTFENKDEDFGFIPVPWSNDPNAYGNSQVAVSMPKLMCIDASQSTGVQQKAALEVLEWMLTTPEGQEYFVGAGFSMPYTNIRPAKYNSMTESISSYINEGKTINLGCLVYMTADGWVKTGDLMLKYLAGDITRDRLAQEINATWRSTIK